MTTDERDKGRSEVKLYHKNSGDVMNEQPHVSKYGLRCDPEKKLCPLPPINREIGLNY